MRIKKLLWILALVPVTPILAIWAASQTATQTEPKLPPKQPLDSYAIQAVEISNPKLSPGRRFLLVDMLSSVAKSRISDRETQEYWIALVGIESAFDSKAKSSVGAIGLGQLMPKFISDFSNACNLPSFTESDLNNDYVNLTLSACYFESLVQKTKSIPYALISYNAGIHSKDLARAKNGMAPSTEPSAYVTKTLILRDRANQGK